jgi:hypothetical protein
MYDTTTMITTSVRRDGIEKMISVIISFLVTVKIHTMPFLCYNTTSDDYYYYYYYYKY